MTTMRAFSSAASPASSPPKPGSAGGDAVMAALPSGGDQHGGRDDRGPPAALVAHRRLGDADGAVDLAADLPDLLALVVGGLGIEFHAGDGGQHLRGEVLGVVSGHLLGLAVGVVLAQVAVPPRLSGDGDADRGGDQTVRLVRLGLAHHAEDHLAEAEILEPLRLWNDLAAGREDAADADQVEVGDPGVPQRHLEGVQLLLVAPHALGEEDLLGYEHRALRTLRRRASRRVAGPRGLATRPRIIRAVYIGCVRARSTENVNEG